MAVVIIVCRGPMCRHLSISRLTVLRFRSTANHCGVGKACVVTWSAITGRAWSGGQLSISCSILVTAIPLPEWCFARAGGVIVRWGWTVALLFLVVAYKEYLEEGCHDEEEAEASVSNEFVLRGVSLLT